MTNRQMDLATCILALLALALWLLALPHPAP